MTGMDTMENLYGKSCDLEAAERRYAALATRFARNFEGSPRFFSSPGRIEILGNHTDHNRGRVMVGAISVDTLACVVPHDEVHIMSEGYPDIRLSLDDLKARPAEYGTSAALVRGVVAGFKSRGLRVGGFRGVMTSDIFKGAGVSSSAAFEVLAAEILNVFYNGGKVGAMVKAQAAQYAENVYFGKPCGLLDQAGIALGGVSVIDFADPKAPVVEKLDLGFGNCSVVLVNTGGDHADLTDEYAAVRAEMELVARHLGKGALREIPEERFYDEIPQLSGKVPGRALLRAMHFYGENGRVEAGAAALRRGDLAEFLSQVNASGDSSWRLLQNLFPEGDRSQRIPLALALSSRVLKGGAVRVHGGGFAGTILALVPREQRAGYVKAMQSVFGEGSVFSTEIRSAGTMEVRLFEKESRRLS